MLPTGRRNTSDQRKMLTFIPGAPVLVCRRKCVLHAPTSLSSTRTSLTGTARRLIYCATDNSGHITVPLRELANTARPASGPVFRLEL